MLFRKNIPARCSICMNARRIDEKNMYCCRKGPVAVSYSCRKFIYDPVKRIPEPKLNMNTDYDFSLE